MTDIADDIEVNEEDTGSEAEALADILAWSKDCPEWQRDALRRLCVKGELEDADLAGISDLLAPDGTFIHPRAAERTKFCSAHNRPAPEAVTSAHADVEPTGAAAFRAFLRHRSTLVPFLRQPSLHSAARQPAGTGSAQILRSISPKSRRFR